MIKKPQIQNKECLNWNEVVDYIKELTGRGVRDWAGHFSLDKKGKVKKINDTKPYQDFWHWLIESQEISNGCLFDLYEFDEIEREENEPWVVEIVDLIFKEFAEYKKQDCLTFYVWW